MQLSMIIPVYNAAPFLKDCLNSVLNQNDLIIEVICVNDGSTDNSLDILNEFAKKNECVKIIDQRNQGVSAARNAGITVAQGQYVLFLDADDELIWDNKIRHVLVDKHNYDFIYYDHQYYNVENNSNDVFTSELNYFENNEELLRKFIDYSSFKIRIGSFIVKRDILLDNNIRFDKDSKYGEDVVFQYYILLSVKSLYHIPYIGLTVRINPSSAMSKKPDLRRFDVFKIRRLFILQLEKRNKISSQLISYFKEHIMLETIVVIFELMARHRVNPFKLRNYMIEHQIISYIDTIGDSNSIYFTKAKDIKQHFYLSYLKVTYEDIKYKTKEWMCKKMDK